MLQKLYNVPLEQLIKNTFQPRTLVDDEALHALALSIKSVGLIHPPVVRKTSDGSFSIIAGERRILACKKLGMQTIPVLVMEKTDQEVATMALIENIQRVDLNPIEIAQSISVLLKKFSLRQEDIAIAIGKNRSTVTNYLRLLKLPKEVQEEIRKSNLSTAHAKTLLATSCPNIQKALCSKIVQEKLSVKETEKIVQKTQNKVPQETLFLNHIADELEEVFGRKVTIQEKMGSGMIQLHYTTPDDLELLFSCLKKQ